MCVRPVKAHQHINTLSTFDFLGRRPEKIQMKETTRRVEMAKTERMLD
uniref:Uncharacterized protein n=1 Tax=Lotus japonicus TaxID=34305 RepID=I3S2B7_LOTJA|nr:unknown [Lotus japonicus]